MVSSSEKVNTIQVFRGIEKLVSLDAACVHLAIGIFDGVHHGHRAVIRSAVGAAEAEGGRSGVLTFHPHPSHLFRPESPTLMLMDIDEKIRLLDRQGVDFVVCQRFDPGFAAIEANAFLQHLRQYCPTLRAVYVGENFRFGRCRAGDVALLTETAQALGIAVFSAERIRHNGQPISSTRIREALQAGKMVEVNSLLGYHYRVSGVVVGGKRIGREIGFPTLNLAWAPECRPRFGVYEVRVRKAGSGGAWEPAVANYGVRPTVDKEAGVPQLESHVIGSTQLDSGDHIEVEWLDFIRPEQSFPSLEALRTQIAEDRAAVAKRHSNDSATH